MLSLASKIQQLEITIELFYMKPKSAMLVLQVLTAAEKLLAVGLELKIPGSRV